MFRAAKALAFAIDDGQVMGCNFLQKTSFACAPQLLDCLSRIENWTAAADVAAMVDTAGEFHPDALVGSLVECGVLLRRGSPEDARDARYADGWRWDLPAGLLHFMLLDNEIMSMPEQEQVQIEHLADSPQPVLARRHTGVAGAIAFGPRPAQCPVLDLMARRRTCRQVRHAPVDAQAIADCLYAGLGVVGYTSNVAGTLPLSMTPSGGGRNPYEAFLLVRNVDGLASGMFHYSATDRTLLPLHSDVPAEPSVLAGDQHWMDDMACIIFLCAHFERTMWKYPDANAYRVVLIEAGHIGQNIMLAATQHGLTACPTAALSHGPIAELCGLQDPITQAPVYALAIGAPNAVEYPGSTA